MKRLFLIYISVSLFLTSCQSVANKPSKDIENTPQPTNIQVSATSNIAETKKENDKAQEVKSYSFFGHYQMTDEFAKITDQNPIDLDYRKESKEFNSSKNFSTQGSVELEAKYLEIWDDEINAIYNKLLSKLSDKEQKILIEAQKGWVQLHINEPKLVNEVFYFRESGQRFGSQGRVQTVAAQTSRIRQRTLELMEYYYLLGNNVDFKYKSVPK